MLRITASYATHNSYAMHNNYAPHNQMKSNKFWVTNFVQQVLGTRVFDYAMQTFSQCYNIQFQTKIELVTNSKMARYWTVQQYVQRNDQHGLGLLDLYTVQQSDISVFTQCGQHNNPSCIKSTYLLKLYFLIDEYLQ